MAVEAVPITPAEDSDQSYLTAAEARALAATLPGLSVLTALSDGAMDAALLLATADIDVAMRYQGRKYLETQVLEFPRIAYGSGIPVNQWLVTPGVVDASSVIWDWDGDADVAVVPQRVKLACLFQAAWLQDSQNSERLEAFRAGLASQGIGSASESYKAAGAFVSGLGDRAHRFMDKYRLRTGGML